MSQSDGYMLGFVGTKAPKQTELRARQLRTSSFLADERSPVEWSGKMFFNYSFLIPLMIFLFSFSILHTKVLKANGHSLQDLLYEHNERQYINFLKPTKNDNRHKDRVTLKKRQQIQERTFSLNGHKRLHNNELERRRVNSNGQLLLPKGPPPFRPSPIMLSFNTFGALEKIKRTKLFKRMYKSKVYYLFVDVLQQLIGLADQVAKKKVALVSSNLATIQAVTTKLIWKGGQKLKLKWPLVMLNPHFLKELLASPTFLVTLFHAIEVAYMSMPINFWLKPLVKLVKQPDPAKEEQVWWRRKRLYDTLNGHGASELQPNLRAMHFRQPGEPSPVAFPRLVQILRDLTGRPAPNPTHYSYPPDNLNLFADHTQLNEEAFVTSPHNWDETMAQPPSHIVYSDEDDRKQLLNHQKRPQNFSQDQEMYMTTAQEESFLANQIGTNTEHGSQQLMQQSADLINGYPSKDSSLTSEIPYTLTTNLGSQPWSFELSNLATGGPVSQNHAESSYNMQQSVQKGAEFENSKLAEFSSDHKNWLQSHKNQLMSPAEFQSLDPHQRDLVLREARISLLETGLSDKLIRHQSRFVESLSSRDDDPLALTDDHLVHNTKLVSPNRSKISNRLLNPLQKRSANSRRDKANRITVRKDHTVQGAAVNELGPRMQLL